MPIRYLAFFGIVLFVSACTRATDPVAMGERHRFIYNGLPAGADDELGKRVVAYFASRPDRATRNEPQMISNGCSAIALCPQAILTVAHCDDEGMDFISEEPTVFQHRYWIAKPAYSAVASKKIMTVLESEPTKTYDPANPPKAKLDALENLVYYDGYKVVRLDKPLAKTLPSALAAYDLATLKDAVVVGYGRVSEDSWDDITYGTRQKGTLPYKAPFQYSFKKPMGDGQFELIAEKVAQLVFTAGSRENDYVLPQGGDSGGGLFDAKGNLIGLNRSFHSRFLGDAKSVEEYRKSARAMEVLPIFNPKPGVGQFDALAELAALKKEFCAPTQCGAAGTSVKVKREQKGAYFFNEDTARGKFLFTVTEGARGQNDKSAWSKEGLCEKLAFEGVPTESLDITTPDGKTEKFACPCAKPEAVPAPQESPSPGSAELNSGTEMSTDAEPEAAATDATTAAPESVDSMTTTEVTPDGDVTTSSEGMAPIVEPTLMPPR